MILRYLNSGLCRFGEHLALPRSNESWEFHAVVKGQCGLILDGNKKLPPRKSHLWLFPPHHVHGWHCLPEKPCEIVVFQFARILPRLYQAIDGSTYFERPLTQEESVFLKHLAASLEADFQKPTALSNLRCQRALLDLTLLALNGREVQKSPQTCQRKTIAKVEASLAWYRQHLRQNPSLEDMAKSVHVSASHLRRMFLQARNQAPSEAMHLLKLEAALRSLSETDAKIEVVASGSGFSSGSDFCRAFKKYKGCTPNQWRKQMSLEETGAPWHSGAERRS